MIGAIAPPWLLDWPIIEAADEVYVCCSNVSRAPGRGTCLARAR